LSRPTKSASSSRNVAFILIKCEPGFEGQVFSALKKTHGVVEVDLVYGSPYDIVVKIRCHMLKELNTTVWRVRRISGIRFTQTLLVGSFA
jgi:DNA-binding Lrp family transcriptional regulator